MFITTMSTPKLSSRRWNFLKLLRTFPTVLNKEWTFV
jgi:hypothetical protein